DVREAYAFYEQESKNPSVLVNKTGLFHRVSRADYNDAANKFQTLILYYGRCAQLLEAMSEPGYTGTSPALEELTRLQSIAKEISAGNPPGQGIGSQGEKMPLYTWERFS
ncbi:MAG: hypothetical protein IKF42_03085, partial [Mogibacterium sp.]|nr:hypothetical protein [Mogibacterium sp.]